MKKGQLALPSELILTLLIFEGIFGLLINTYLNNNCVTFIQSPQLKPLTQDIVSNSLSLISYLFSGLIYLIGVLTFIGVSCEGIPSYIITVIQLPILTVLIYSILIPVSQTIFSLGGTVIDSLKTFLTSLLPWLK